MKTNLLTFRLVICIVAIGALAPCVSSGNVPPTVSINSPTNGSSFTAPASFTLNASANDTDGSVVTVEFFEGANKLGEDTSRPYRFNWDNLAAGNYTLTARVTDDGGAVSTSSVVNIVVTNGPGPSVSISSPTDGTVLAAPATFNLQASVSGGSVSQVEFFNGAQSLGVDTGNPYRITVNDLSAGTYSLSAVAMDAQGSKSTNSITLIVNALPTVAISSPADATGLIAPATFALRATASDSDGTITHLQFFQGTTAIGLVTTNPATLPIKSLAVGSYTLTVIATDNLGGKATARIDLLVKNRPTVAVTAPAAGARLTNVTTLLSGTAGDSVGVASVQYSLNSGPFVTATGRTNWSAQLAMPPGTNVVRLRSVDTFGSFSRTNTRQFFQVVTSALTLSVTGPGTVSGATNQQVLEVGRGYRVSAIAGSASFFSNWTGTASGALPTLGFIMQSNMALQANFVPNPFLRTSGAFNGLFCETSEVRPGSSGDFKLIVTKSGRYTASLRPGGRRYATSGKLDLEGRATNLIVRLGTNSLIVRWAVDLHGLDQATGTVSNEFWLAALVGDRATFNATTNPAPLAARYTFIVPGREAADSPEGAGRGTLRVTRDGMGLLVGSLADGTALTRAVPISKSGDWGLYAPLYQLQGSLLGWMQFDTNAPLDDFSGPVDWIKPTLPPAKFYPAGFTNRTLLTGSRYVAPITATNRVVDLTNGAVILSGGNLSQNCTNDIQLGTNNRFTNMSPDKLAVTLSLGSGLFKGTFTDSNAARIVSFSGALLQKSTNGAGYFPGTNQSGRVLIECRP